MSKTSWKAFPCCINELKIATTLACGQSFRWKELKPGEWTGVIKDEVWKFKQTSSELLYQVFTRDQNHTNNASSYVADTKSFDINDIKKEPIYDTKPSTKKRKQTKDTGSLPVKKLAVKSETDLLANDKNEATIRNYFQLNVNLTNLYKQWALADSNFEDISTNFPGIRILRQDPVENLYSFICSSNNHISRISSMVEKLCVNFGEELSEVDGLMYYQFPSVLSLASSDVEHKLRDLGFGYRARYINQTSKYIIDNHSEEWLYSLRNLDYMDVKKELMKFCGVGAKVADCVCLMSMDQSSSIPVDTHVWQIAARHYIPKLQTSKSLTDKLYQEIGDFFRSLWGEYAGWAHSVLFTADLKRFQLEKKSLNSNKKKKITVKKEKSDA